jgi:hypothetical protein
MAMNRSTTRLAASMATILVASFADLSSAAESALVAQDLTKVNAAGEVTARWVRAAGSYAVEVVVERSRPRPAATNSPGSTLSPAQPLTAAPPYNEGTGHFIGNTIANLRGLEPAFGCNRTLTLVDGRRIAPNTAGVAPPLTSRAPSVLHYDPKAKQPRVEVWLLRADGTQIPSADYRCTSYAESTEARYEYPVADGGQAVAAAVRIDDEYYIETLQPLELKTAL